MYNAGEPVLSTKDKLIELMMEELACTYEEALEVYNATEKDWVEGSSETDKH